MEAEGKHCIRVPGFLVSVVMVCTAGCLLRHVPSRDDGSEWRTLLMRDPICQRSMAGGLLLTLHLHQKRASQPVVAAGCAGQLCRTHHRLGEIDLAMVFPLNCTSELIAFNFATARQLSHHYLLWGLAGTSIGTVWISMPYKWDIFFVLFQ